MTQSGVWVGPRHFISTLHLHIWIGGEGHPSDSELEVMRSSGAIFEMETEICSNVMTEHSPKLKILTWSIPDDLGVFELDAKYPARTEWIDIDLLMERDELNVFGPNHRVACIGSSGKLTEGESAVVKNVVIGEMQNKLNSKLAQAILLVTH